MGKTHACVGAALALAVLQPTTSVGCACALAGGVLGGLICDIDTTSSVRNLVAGVLAAGVLGVAAMFAVDHVWGTGLCVAALEELQEMLRRNEVPLGVIAFLALCALGTQSPHRTFTHSLVGLVAFSYCVAAVVPALAMPFVVGMAAHIALDLTNKKGVQLFYPAKRRFCLGWLSSGGWADRAILAASFAAAAVLLSRLV